MKITKISVSYSWTESLGDYNNVRSSVSLDAEIEPGDVLDEKLVWLEQLTKREVERQIDDALEESGHAPKFYDGPCFNVYVFRAAGVAVIIPANLPRNPPPIEASWSGYWWDLVGHGLSLIHI